MTFCMALSIGGCDFLYGSVHRLGFTLYLDLSAGECDFPLTLSTGGCEMYS